MNDDPYHWPPELFNLLVDSIPLLCRSKTDVLTFLRGCGVPESDLSPLRQRLAADAASINKYEITRTILEEVNERGDSALGLRRTVLKRVTEFEDFSTCWPNDQLKAKGLVSEVRRVVNVKDSFTRMDQAREAERLERRKQREESAQRAAQRREQRQSLRSRLAPLHSATDPHARGLALEPLLNEIFALDGLLIREAFVLRRHDGSPDEQIDGVIELDGHQYLVEMKWWSEKIGPDPMARQLVRVYGRADVRGLFISASGYTRAAIDECRRALTSKVVILAELSEISLLLERDEDVAEWLREKVRRAVVERQPLTIPHLGG